MKRFNILFIGLLILSLASCDEGNNDLLPYTLIEGQVLEYGTNEPVENAEVILYELVSSGGFSSGDDPIDTVRTNANGEYSLEYRGSRPAGVKAFAETYFPTSRVQYDGIYARQRNVENLVLDPVALLELHIKNVNPVDNNDNIRYSGAWSGGGAQDNLGMSVDFYNTQQVKGNREIHVYWNVTKNGNSIFYEDFIYCKGHEITKYEIFY